jgi:magnesium-transporting ATPase (P-type)
MAVSNSDDAAEGHVSGQANEPMSLPAHSLSSVQVAQELRTETTRGLSSDDAAARLAKYGLNNLGEEKGVNALEILVAQVANAMTLVSFLPWFLYC